MLMGTSASFHGSIDKDKEQKKERKAITLAETCTNRLCIHTDTTRPIYIVYKDSIFRISHILFLLDITNILVMDFVITRT